MMLLLLVIDLKSSDPSKTFYILRSKLKILANWNTSLVLRLLTLHKRFSYVKENIALIFWLTQVSLHSNLLHSDNSAPYTDVPSYRRLIRRLIYLTNTRPNITFATQQLSQFLTSPTEKHYLVATRILRYLKKCPGQGLFFPSKSPLFLSGFSDADWAGCLDSRRSISGQCFFLSNSLISWRTKK